MKPSSAPPKNKQSRARNAMLLNLFATPGLGSLMAGRWVEGLGQLFLSVAGFVMVLVWFFKVMIPYYGMMFGDTPPPIHWALLGEGALLFAISWFWSLITSISLHRAASQTGADALRLFGAPEVKINEAKIQAGLVGLPNWARNGEIISRTYEFNDFPEAMRFVNAVAVLAEQAQHHPDIDVRWNKVTLALTTHDAGGLTDKDFALARACDAALGQ